MSGNRALGSQMETLISNLGGDPPTNPVRSKYATAEQMERAIVAAGGVAAEHPVRSKYATAEQMERLIDAVRAGGEGGGGGDITVEAFTATDNGTFTAPTGKAYSPVTVSIPSVSGVSF